ncbi:hypothetical protein HEP87_04910 [Streptomyces sp. S1D4-11]|nr:hypothetical protein [Streptomyces sp. S1D4-11]QIY93590.1 hypothetical protein HEP87_04910 [Streptomyces sp. S1D4-11]
MPAWSGLPPGPRCRRSSGPRTGRAPSPTPGSAVELTTWQNPSFTGTLSHAVLDGAPGGLVKDLLAAPVGPASGLELPSLSLPVASPAESGEGPVALPVQRMTSPSRPSVRRAHA